MIFILKLNKYNRLILPYKGFQGGKGCFSCTSRFTFRCGC